MKPITTFIFLFLPLLVFSQKFALQGKVYDKDTHQPIKGTVVDLFGSDGGHCTTTSDSTGHYDFGMLTPGRNYDTVIICLLPNVTYSVTVNANRQEYFNFPDSIVFVTDAKTGKMLFNEDFELVKAFKNHPYLIHGVSFGLDSAQLTKPSRDTLNKIVRFLKANPNLRIEIDNHLMPNYRQHDCNLSQARAQYVVNYLIGQGIDSARMKAKGWGATRPLAGCSEQDIEKMKTEQEKHEARERDLRVEFTILEFDYFKK